MMENTFARTRWLRRSANQRSEGKSGKHGKKDVAADLAEHHYKWYFGKLKTGDDVQVGRNYPK